MTRRQLLLTLAGLPLAGRSTPTAEINAADRARQWAELCRRGPIDEAKIRTAENQLLPEGAATDALTVYGLA